MNAVVQRWGNSLALRIPKALANDVRMSQGVEVELAVVAGKLVVDSKGQKKYSLESLLKGITRKNRHGEEDFGAPQGKEIW